MVTADLAGLSVDEVNPLISEWDYGDYEGTTTQEIRKAVPNWLVWTHGCPGGETTAAVCERADRAIALALEHMETRDVSSSGTGTSPARSSPAGSSCPSTRASGSRWPPRPSPCADTNTAHANSMPSD